MTACTATADRLCTACSTCTTAQYETVACTAATNRQCADKHLFVASISNQSIGRFGAITTLGNIAPVTRMTSVPTPRFGLGYDPTRKELYVANSSTTVPVFSATADGVPVPLRTITGFTTEVRGLYLDRGADRLYVNDSNRIVIIDNVSTVNGPIPVGARQITGLPNPSEGIFVDTTTDRLFVLSAVANTIQIYDQASTVNGAHASVVTRTIAGASTTLSGPVSAFVHAASQRLFVTSFYNARVLVFDAATANGDVAPIQTLQGASTLLSGPEGILIEPTTRELFVTSAIGNQVMVYADALTANGDVAPSRTISGASTGLNFPCAIAFDF